MRRPILVELPEPCTESWDEMTPAPGGRHCTACSKTVIDFTSYTDAELFAFLSKRKEAICGRLRQSQIGLELHPPVRSLYARLGGWRAAALLLCTQLFSSPLLAQKKGVARTEAAARAGRGKHVLLQSRINAFASGMPGVPCTFSLQIDGSAHQVTTDSAGKFVLRLRPKTGSYDIRWKEQETAGGTILPGQLRAGYADLPGKLHISWHGEQVMPPVVIVAERIWPKPVLDEPSSGGVMPYHPPPPKKSFLRRLTGFLHKKG